MKSIIIIFSILLASQMVHAAENDKWNKSDNLLMGSSVLFSSIDCFQTRYIFDNPDKFNEKNDIIKYMVKKTGRGSIPVYFLCKTLVDYLIADHLKTIHIGRIKIPLRKIYLVWVNTKSFNAIYDNHSIGIKIQF